MSMIEKEGEHSPHVEELSAAKARDLLCLPVKEGYLLTTLPPHLYDLP